MNIRDIVKPGQVVSIRTKTGSEHLFRIEHVYEDHLDALAEMFHPANGEPSYRNTLVRLSLDSIESIAILEDGHRVERCETFEP